MSVGQEVVREAVKHRIAERTAGRIHNLEVELVADHLVIRGQAPSYYLKQLAIQATLDEVGPWGNAQLAEIDVQISVLPAC
jgi:hypothetical protein